MALLEVKDIDVFYGNIQALRKVSFSVNEGDIACLIGANGAGKSTLMKAVLGMEPITSGSITFEDTVLADEDVSLRTDEIANLGIALVPEGRRVFGEMSVEENLLMGAFLRKDNEKIYAKMEEMYALFPILGERRHQKSSQLSGGEQQMLAIARALMNNPRLLLLDEPGLGLAPLIVAHIFETIKKISQEEKVTVFLVEQNAKMALQSSKHGYVMETGSIVLADESDKLLHNDRVRAAYLGE